MVIIKAQTRERKEGQEWKIPLTEAFFFKVT